MLTVVASIILGMIFTLAAINNSQEIALNIFGLNLYLPLYITLGLAFLLGTFVTTLVSLFDSVATGFDLKKKENSYKNALNVNDKLRSDIAKLNLENTRLKQEIAYVKSNEAEKRRIARNEKVKEFFYKITHPNNTYPSHSN